jgi:2-isopropylmalate synthase
MKHIAIADSTLCREGSVFSFKERIEIARQLERLAVDVIELPEIKIGKTDILLVKTVSSFVKKSILSVGAGLTEQSVTDAAAALSHAAKPRIRIELPMSPVGMEYVCHKKPDKMLLWISHIVEMAKNLCPDVEFCAVDATRAEPDFLSSAIEAAEKAGATSLAVCDSAAELLPDDFAAFAQEITKKTSLPLTVHCDNKNGLASAEAILAIVKGAAGVKTNVGGNGISLEVFADMVRNCGPRYGFASSIRYTELHRTIGQIAWISDNAKNEKTVKAVVGTEKNDWYLDAADDREAVAAAVLKLGYDLSDEDNDKVFEEFQRVAAKKKVGAKELEAIVASVALQCPATYVLENYVINNGNIIASSAQITLKKGDALMQGVCIGDGPVDAAFRAIEQIIGSHYELDDFQIQAVTEGKEAMGSALVRLRSEGKLYSGNGISTDIIGAAIRAYLGAVNKIVYEEA